MLILKASKNIYLKLKLLIMRLCLVYLILRSIKSEYKQVCKKIVIMNYIKKKYKRVEINSKYLVYINITYNITLRKKYYFYDSFFLNIFTLI